MGTEGMKASLVSREVIADSIELTARGYMFDALVAIVSCDKTIPGAAMALARVDVPSVLLYGGSIMPGKFKGVDVTIQDVFEAVGRHANGDMSLEDLIALRGCGLPRARRVRRSVHRQHDGDRDGDYGDLTGCKRKRSGDRSGQRRRQLQRRQSRDGRSTPRHQAKRHLYADGVRNAIASVAATGGSTNAVLHLMALAQDAGVDLELEDFDRISKRTPTLVDLKRGETTSRRTCTPPGGSS